MILSFISFVGIGALSFFRYVGNLSLFTFEAVTCCFRPPYYFRQIATEIYKIGYLSLPIVGLK
jgi:phospholipid/cholesterol/gamma-HCH transport system permease protein